MIRVSTLFSGSSGNCTLMRSENTAILIDAGRNCKAVCEALRRENMDISDISAIFVTHEHRDHISALDVMMRKCPIPIHVTSPSARELCRGRSAAENACVHRGVLFEETVGDLTVRSFALPHDSAAHVGYVVCDIDGDKAGLATDMGFPTVDALENLTGCRQVVLESNHDISMLMHGPYPQFLKDRVRGRGGHLSNEDSARLGARLALSGTETICLAHLSAENNTPDLAMDAFSRIMDEIGRNPIIKIAKRSDITDL